jgi:NADH-quinone oxidoreductase subunit G
MVINRGAQEEIDVFRDEAGNIQFPLANKLSGNVVDLCPVGALGDKDFLYKQRVWFMRSHDNVCANCSTGCSIKVEENQDRVYRLKPRENPHVNQWWMCDEGRYGWKHVHSPQRVTQLRRREKDGHVNVEWTELVAEIDQKLRRAGRLAAVISPHLTVEEAYLLCKYIRGIDPEAVLAVGPIPMEGTDERFPNGFTIRAEKCPNRKGVEAIIGRIGGGLLNWGDFLGRVEGEPFGAVWIAGGYPKAWHDEVAARKFAGVKTLILQDCFASPLWERADYQIPGATFAEREGSYVNANDRLQSFRWAIRPPAGVLTEGQLYWQLLKKPGLYRAKAVLDDVSREFAYFSAAAQGVPEVGIDLKVNQFADTSVPVASASG